VRPVYSVVNVRCARAGEGRLREWIQLLKSAISNYKVADHNAVHLLHPTRTEEPKLSVASQRISRSRSLVSIPIDDGFVQDRKVLELISTPRHQLAHTRVDSNKRAEAVPLDLEKPIGVGKQLASAPERHGLEMRTGH
jgi:hypothetical protein